MWLGQDDTMQGFGCPAAARARTVSSISGCRASMGWAIRSAAGGRRRARQRRRTVRAQRGAVPRRDRGRRRRDTCISGCRASTDSAARSASGSGSSASRSGPCRSRRELAPFVPGGVRGAHGGDAVPETGRHRRDWTSSARCTQRRMVRCTRFRASTPATTSTGSPTTTSTALPTMNCRSRGRRRAEGLSAADDELNGFGDGEELSGFGGRRRARAVSRPVTDEVSNGFAADDELDGFADDDDCAESATSERR